jgi:hypothetical protein
LNGQVGLGFFGLVVMIGSMLLLIAAAFRACKNCSSAEIINPLESAPGTVRGDVCI